MFTSSCRVILQQSSLRKLRRTFKTSFTVTDKMSRNFDPSVYAQYYDRKEDLAGLLDLQDETLTSATLLLQIQTMLPKSPSLINRKFTKLSPPQPENDQEIIRVMQWNILAQGLCIGKDNFIRCPKDALDWNNRRLQILQEIFKIDPDVLCMQEVDHYGFLRPILESVGYSGTFFPKPDSPALYSKDSNGPDGCAVFYRTSKLKLINKEKVVLKDVCGSFTNQVSVIHILETKSTPSQQFCVATTHLKAKHGWDELRLQQGSYLLKYLQDKVQGAPLIVCGDFNAESTEPIYEVFSTKDTNLKSAYTLLSDHGKGEPPYTTWKIRGNTDGSEVEVCRTIDYMWFTSNTLQVQQLCEIPTDEEIGPDRLPSHTYPSDHFSLAADFTFI